jgi:hypothetical protein
VKTPKRIRGSSKGKQSNAGLSSNSHGVLRPFGASAQASPLNPGLPHRVSSVLRVSHPLDGLLLARTSGLISCRKRPWGFALQGISLTTRSCQLVAEGLPSWRFSDASSTLMKGCVALGTCKPLSLQPKPLVAFRVLLRLRIRTVGGLLHPEPSGRFPRELFCLSKVLPTQHGHVTRNVITHALFPSNRPFPPSKLGKSGLINRVRSSELTIKRGISL